MKDGFKIWSIWEWELWRRKTNINQWKDGNIVTDEGLNHLLNVYFSGEDPITSWYLAVFEDDYTPLATDTYAVPGYTECDTLSEYSRPGWQENGALSKSITNISNKAGFTFALNKTIYGGAMVGGGEAADNIADKLGQGVLFCASKFSAGSQLIKAGDVIKVTVTITAASG